MHGDMRASIIKTALIRERGHKQRVEDTQSVLRGVKTAVEMEAPLFFVLVGYHIRQYIFNPSRGLGIYK